MLMLALILICLSNISRRLIHLLTLRDILLACRVQLYKEPLFKNQFKSLKKQHVQNYRSYTHFKDKFLINLKYNINNFITLELWFINLDKLLENLTLFLKSENIPLYHVVHQLYYILLIYLLQVFFVLFYFYSHITLLHWCS